MYVCSFSNEEVVSTTTAASSGLSILILLVAGNTIPLYSAYPGYELI